MPYDAVTSYAIVEQHDEGLECCSRVRRRGKGKAAYALQPLCVSCGGRTPAFEQLVETAHLCSAECRLQLAQAVIEAVTLEGHSDLCLHATVIAKHSKPISEAAVRGRDHSAFASRDDLAQGGS